MDLVSITWAYCCASVRSRIKDERGASLIEYALLLVLIAVVCIAGITMIGESTNTRLSKTGSQLQ